MKDIVAKTLFGFACFCVAFGYGFISAEFQLFPYSIFRMANATFLDMKEHWKNDALIEPTRHLNKAYHPGAGVTIRDDEKMQPGLTFMAGLFDDQIGARLLRADGEVVHSWNVSYNTIWPEPRREQEPLSDWEVFLHGIIALPDGSIVFNFDAGGSLVKMDHCGEVQWKIDEYIHHSIFPADDGTFWVPLDDEVAKISAQGEILRLVSIPKMIRKNRLDGTLYIHKPDRTKFEEIHPNDVELLPAEWVAAFPNFEVGDVLYSMRELNLIIVFDFDTEVVKWYQHGPWLRQHDPDFLPNGKISIFNNNMDRDASNIMTIDPQTREVAVIYEGTQAEPFYTSIRGKHQHLDNGNILITEAQRGRAFEVTGDGDIVWEYINRYDDERVAVVAEAIRYPPDYFDRDHWSCENAAS